MGKSISFHSRNACVSCAVLCLAEGGGGGGGMKISALSHTRAVRLCVERGLIYSTQQLLLQRSNRRSKEEQYKIKKNPCLFF